MVLPKHAVRAAVLLWRLTLCLCLSRVAAKHGMLAFNIPSWWDDDPIHTQAEILEGLLGGLQLLPHREAAAASVLDQLLRTA